MSTEEGLLEQFLDEMQHMSPDQQPPIRTHSADKFAVDIPEHPLMDKFSGTTLVLRRSLLGSVQALKVALLAKRMSPEQVEYLLGPERRRNEVLRRLPLVFDLS